MIESHAYLLVIQPSTLDFIQNLVNYYISEASAYRQIAEIYADEVADISATTFGIIWGCVYSGFLQAYANQKQNPPLEDIQEFNQLMKQRVTEIKKAIRGAKS